MVDSQFAHCEFVRRAEITSTRQIANACQIGRGLLHRSRVKGVENRSMLDELARRRRAYCRRLVTQKLTYPVDVCLPRRYGPRSLSRLVAALEGFSVLDAEHPGAD
jgi:hypothetical protein